MDITWCLGIPTSSNHIFFPQKKAQKTHLSRRFFPTKIWDIIPHPPHPHPDLPIPNRSPPPQWTRPRAAASGRSPRHRPPGERPWRGPRRAGGARGPGRMACLGWKNHRKTMGKPIGKPMEVMFSYVFLIKVAIISGVFRCHFMVSQYLSEITTRLTIYLRTTWNPENPWNIGKIMEHVYRDLTHLIVEHHVPSKYEKEFRHSILLFCVTLCNPTWTDDGQWMEHHAWWPWIYRNLMD